MAAAPAAARQPVSHVIFDMDGLLLDTENAYTVAQQEILGRLGREFTWELKAKMMGKKALAAAQTLIDELQLQGQLSAQDFLQQREAILDRLFPESALMPGAERLLRHLAAHGVPMAVATSSHRRHFDIKTRRHRALFELFDHIITGDQVAQGKPHPEIFLAAAAAWPSPPQPSACLVLEDAPVGVQAASAAGMQAALVPDPNLPASAYAGLGASAVLPSLEAFQPEHWGLPPFAPPSKAAAAAAVTAAAAAAAGGGPSGATP